MKIQFWGLIALAFACSACGAYQLDTAQTELRNSFATGNYAGTVQLIENFEQNGVYQSKDEVLLSLEQGTINHFAGNYKQSSAYFTNAENKIDDLFTKSVSRGIKSFMVNDNLLAYDGEDYEDIYINIFKCLNYIHVDELEKALVEARRVAYKLGRLSVKYNGLVESLSRADSTDSNHDIWKTGKTNVEDSALGHYLAAILFAKTNKPSDARIEFELLLEAYREQPSVYSFNTPGKQELQNITQPQRYNVLVTAFSGRSPIKTQNDFRVYHDETDTYLKFSLPSLNTYNSQVSNIEVVVNGSRIYTVNLIEEMDLVASEVYKVKEPIIYARAFVRTFLKAVAANKLEQVASEKDASLGLAVNLLGMIAQETTEKADLRSWQTMPGKAYAKVIQLPPGEHILNIQYYNNNGALLYSEKRNVQISENENLELVESIYWN